MEKAKKKRIKKIITWVSLALVVALLTAMPLIARQEAEADGPVASILSAEVTRGTISTALRGGGTISAETVEEVKLPSGVKITEFLVKNGQFVTEGTPVAAVDKVSVMTAIMEVSETMEYLREELEDARDEKVSSNIKATAGGRVKKVFAQKGEEVREVMLRDGALAVLSLDGLMAVKIEEHLPLTTGEAVTVTIGEADVTGRVESNLDGVVIITVEDEGYEIGAPVTVSTVDGQKLGEGTLYIHNAWKATAYTGTIETVSAKEEKTLSSGATLFTLKDRDYEGELRHRASQHREYEELLQELFQMYQSGVLTAPCDGEVEGVDEDSAYLLSAIPEGWVLAPLTNTVKEGEEKGWTVMLLSNETANYDPRCANNEGCTLSEENAVHGPNCITHCNGSAECGAKTHRSDCESVCTGTMECKATSHNPGCPLLCTKASVLGKCINSQYTNPENHHPDCIHSCTYGTRTTACQGTKHHALGCIEACKEADGLKKQCDATGEHKLSCIRACIEADTLGKCPATPNHSADCIEKCAGKLECTANKHIVSCPHYNLIYTAVAGIVVRTVEGKIEYTYESAEPVPAVKMGSGYVITAQPNPKTMVNGPAFVDAGGVKVSTGDIILIVTGKNASGTAIVKDKVILYARGSAMDGFDKDALAGMMGGFGGMGGFDISSMIGGFAGFGNYGAAAPEEEPLFDLEGDTLLTVTPHDKAKLFIAIDEKDIAKVSLGMKATVKVEALKGREFEAEVTNIALSGKNNGGSSKFSVELTLPMEEDMLSGMSASAVLPLEEKADILVIPAAALSQQGAKTVVFTGLDEKTGEPSKPVEVKTGATDGEHVEVISGLSEGQKVYYSYYDTLELDTSAEADKYTLR